MNAAKGRYSRRNFEPQEREICSYINSLLAGCAGSRARTRLRTLFPCLPGKNREFQQKSGLLGDGCRENSQEFSVLVVKFPTRRIREFFRS